MLLLSVMVTIGQAPTLRMELTTRARRAPLPCRPHAAQAAHSGGPGARPPGCLCCGARVPSYSASPLTCPGVRSPAMWTAWRPDARPSTEGGLSAMWPAVDCPLYVLSMLPAPSF